MATGSRSIVWGSLVTLAFAFAWVAAANAGAPAAMDEGTTTKAAASADTSHAKAQAASTKSAPTTAKRKAGTPATKSTPATKPAVTATAAKSTPATKPAVTATATKATPATKAAVPRVAPAKGSVASAPTRPSTAAKIPASPTRDGIAASGASAAVKTSAPAPIGIARVAPAPATRGLSSPTSSATHGAVAQGRTPSSRAAVLVAPKPAAIARVAPPPASPNRVVAMMPSITKLPPSSRTQTGSTLATSGATTVHGPSMAGGRPLAPVKPVPTAAITSLKLGSTKAAASAEGVAQKASKGPPQTVAKSGAAVAAPLEDHVTYQYNALGRRDPFQSLLEGEYVGADLGGQAPPDLGGLKLVGVVWGSTDQFAMVEDVRGDSYILRRGDRVMNGYVEGLKRDAMIVNITVDGQSQSVTIPITRKGDKSNANR